MTATLSKIRITDITGSPLAVSTEKAQRVHELLVKYLQANEVVELSFEGVGNLITAFLNTAVGQLYSEFSEDHIRKYLRVVDTTPEVRVMLKNAVENAKRYFSDPTPYQESFKELGGPIAL